MSPVLVLLGAAAVVHAEPGPGRPVMGILEVPALFGAVDLKGPPGATPPADGKLRVYDGPSKTARLLRTVGAADLPTEEHSYEASGALVTGMTRDAYEVRLQGGSALVRAADAGAYHPLAELLGGMGYLAEAWDGRLYEHYSSAAPLKTQAKPGADIELRESRGGKRGFWLKVRVLGPGRCEGKKPKVLGEGWLPAHAPSGAPAAWFRSRGC